MSDWLFRKPYDKRWDYVVHIEDDISGRTAWRVTASNAKDALFFARRHADTIHGKVITTKPERVSSLGSSEPAGIIKRIR